MKRKVVRAEILGFCMGVRRAVDLAVSLADGPPRGGQGSVFTLGPLIHNRRVIEELNKQGIREAADPKDIPDGSTVLIRAHGISPSVHKLLSSRDLRIVDATCPRVVRSQDRTETYASEGYTVVLAGDEKHGEIRSLAGFAGRSIIVKDSAEAEAVPADGLLAVIGQTTLTADEYGEICKVIQERNPGAVILNTVCPATEQRQAALLRLAGEAEALVIIGGKNSANTARLVLTARETGKPSWHIEGAADIPEKVFAYSVIGLSAGASTPDWIIDEVEERLKND